MLLLSSGVTLAVPFATGRIIDMIHEGSEKGDTKERLLPFCKILATIFLIGAVANFGRVYLIQTSGRSSCRLNLAVISCVLV